MNKAQKGILFETKKHSSFSLRNNDCTLVISIEEYKHPCIASQEKPDYSSLSKLNKKENAELLFRLFQYHLAISHYPTRRKPVSTHLALAPSIVHCANAKRLALRSAINKCVEQLSAERTVRNKKRLFLPYLKKSVLLRRNVLSNTAYCCWMKRIVVL